MKALGVALDADLGIREDDIDVMIALSEANVNVDLAYTVNGDQLAIATDDFYNARDALS